MNVVTANGSKCQEIGIIDWPSVCDVCYPAAHAVVSIGIRYESLFFVSLLRLRLLIRANSI